MIYQYKTKHILNSLTKMSNKRWDSNDKIALMKLYSSGKSYDDIGTILNRSPNAIKLRLESIVYENLARDKPLSMLTRMLNTDVDTIKQLYYSHKSFRQSRNEPVKDVIFPTVPVIPIVDNRRGMGFGMGAGMGAGMGTRMGNMNPNNEMQNKHSIINQDLNQNKIQDKAGILIGGKGIEGTFENTVEKIIERTIDRKVEKSLEQIENENHVLDEIIKNYRMRRHLRKLYVDGKLDKKSIELYEKLVKE